VQVVAVVVVMMLRERHLRGQAVLVGAVMVVLPLPQQREQSTLDQAEAVLILAVQVVQVALES
tara:strand:+ start:484 stop:672 length:189 start_codon:yes stop_codon:yes gene_type:complete